MAKKLLLKAPVQATHYTADAAITWCFDHRFSEVWGKFIAWRKFKIVDPIILAGGAMWGAHTKNKAWRDFLVFQVLASVRLHKTPIVILTTHEDCGGYGGSIAFGDNKRKEEARHRKDLSAGAKLISSEIKKALADWKKNGVVVGGKLIPSEIVRKTYPKTVKVERAFVGLDGIWEL